MLERPEYVLKFQKACFPTPSYYSFLCQKVPKKCNWFAMGHPWAVAEMKTLFALLCVGGKLTFQGGNQIASLWWGRERSWSRQESLALSPSQSEAGGEVDTEPRDHFLPCLKESRDFTPAFLRVQLTLSEAHFLRVQLTPSEAHFPFGSTWFFLIGVFNDEKVLTYKRVS